MNTLLSLALTNTLLSLALTTRRCFRGFSFLSFDFVSLALTTWRCIRGFSFLSFDVSTSIFRVRTSDSLFRHAPMFVNLIGRELTERIQTTTAHFPRLDE